MVFVYEGWTSIALDGRRNTLYFEKRGLHRERVRGARRAGAGASSCRAPRRREKRLRQALAAAPEVVLTLDLAGAARPLRRRPVRAVPALPVTVSEHGADLDGDRPARRAGHDVLGRGDRGSLGARRRSTAACSCSAHRPTRRTLAAATRAAIARTAECLLEPSMTSYDDNFGIPGIRKWARMLTDEKDAKGWPKLCPDDESLRAGPAVGAPGAGRDGLARRSSRRSWPRPPRSSVTRSWPPRRPPTPISAAAGRSSSTLAVEPGATAADLAALLPELADAEEAAARALR